MTNTARRVLESALASVPTAPRDGWQHFLTGLTDDGYGVFSFDHPSGALLRVLTNPAFPLGVVVETYDEPGAETHNV